MRLKYYPTIAMVKKISRYFMHELAELETMLLTVIRLSSFMKKHFKIVDTNINKL